MISDDALIYQFDDHYKKTKSGLQAQWENTRKCQAFYAGNGMVYMAQQGQNQTKRIVEINKVKPIVNAVRGFMIQNRRRVKYVANAPYTNNEVRGFYSSYANALRSYLRQKCSADYVESQQNTDLLICGYGAVETAMTYGDGYAATSPNGEMVKVRLEPDKVGWDPTARAMNLTDSRWVMYPKDYVIEDALNLFQEATEENLVAPDDEYDEAFVYCKSGEGNIRVSRSSIDWQGDKKSRLCRVYFYQWYEIEKFYRAQNPIYGLESPEAVQIALIKLEQIAAQLKENDDLFKFDPKSEILTFDGKTKSKLAEMFGDFIKPYEQSRRVYYTAVISGQHVFTKFRSALQDGFSVKFQTGDFDERNKIWTGMVQSLMEPTAFYNKSMTEMMYILGSNSKGGVLVEKGAVDDVREFEQRYSKTDAVIEVNEGGLAKIQPKKEPFQPTGYETVITMADNAIVDVSGIDKTFLGSSENRQETALLQKRRVKQVVTTLASYFDAISLFQELDARADLTFMRIYAQNNDGSLFRSVGPDGKEQFLRVSEEKMVEDYDILVQEAPEGPEEKQEYAMIMQTIGDKLLAAGDAASAKAIYAIAIKNLPIDEVDLQKIVEILTPQQQSVDPAYVQQLEQQVQQLQADMNMAAVEDLKASAAKKLSDIQVNKAKIDQTAATIHKTLADAQRSEQEAVKTHLEGTLIQGGNVNNVDVRI